MHRCLLILMVLMLLPGWLCAQDRRTLVLRDRDQLARDPIWIYNNLPRGLAEARTPEQLPALLGRYRPQLDYAGNVVQSCIHCHQIRDAERLDRRISHDGLALRVKYVGQYGDHAAAKRAGFQVGDLIIAAGDQTRRLTESQFIAYALSNRRGKVLPVNILRDQESRELQLPMQ